MSTTTSVIRNGYPPHTLTGGSQTTNITQHGIVACGIDTLVIGFCVSSYIASEVDFSVLSEAKIQAGETKFKSRGCGVTWYGSDFSVQAKGSRGYEWIISNDDLSVCIAKSAQSGRVYPEIYVTFRSSYLWGVGYKMAYSRVRSWLNRWAVVVGEKVSRCDLTVDIDMSLPTIDIGVEIVGRARTKSDHFGRYCSGLRVTGYSIGTGDIAARIYDKTLEVKVSQKEWFYDLWRSNGWNGDTPVTRFEFQLRREILKEYSVDSFSDLTERLADIWRYCSVDWLSVRSPGRTKVRHRWETKDYWIVLQNLVDYFGSCRGMLRYKQKQPKIKHMADMARGVLTTLFALHEQVYGPYAGRRDLRWEINSWSEDPAFLTAVDERKKQLAILN